MKRKTNFTSFNESYNDRDMLEKKIHSLSCQIHDIGIQFSHNFTEEKNY